jgi:chromosome segregation ATPase
MSYNNDREARRDSEDFVKELPELDDLMDGYLSTVEEAADELIAEVEPHIEGIIEVQELLKLPSPLKDLNDSVSDMQVDFRKKLREFKDKAYDLFKVKCLESLELKDQVKELESEKDSLADQIKELEKERDKLERKVSSLEGEIESLNDTNDEISEEPTKAS